MRASGGFVGVAVGCALAAGLVATPSVARADDMACIASSERELALRKQSKLRDALKELVACGAPGCPEEIRAECNRRLTELNAALPTVVLGSTDGAGNDLAAVTVSLDGAVVARSLDGRALQVDPGSHVLRFEALGKPPVEKTVVISEGVKDRHVSVSLGGPEAAAPPVTPAVTLTGPAPSQAPANANGGGLRTAGYVVGGVGLAGAIAAGVVGGLAISKSSAAKNECTPTCATNTNPSAQSDMQTASSYATFSTVGLSVGGALAAAGVVMVLVGGPSKAGGSSTTGLLVSPSFLPSGGGLSVSGGW